MKICWRLVFEGLLLIFLASGMFFYGSFAYAPEYQKVAWKVAAGHEYIEGEFDCGDFSEALVAELKAAGYEARTVLSTDSESDRCLFDPEWWKENYGEELFCHSWVVLEIPIEATTGEIIDPETYREVYLK